MQDERSGACPLYEWPGCALFAPPAPGAVTSAPLPDLVAWEAGLVAVVALAVGWLTWLLLRPLGVTGARRLAFAAGTGVLVAGIILEFVSNAIRDFTQTHALLMAVVGGGYLVGATALVIDRLAKRGEARRLAAPAAQTLASVVTLARNQQSELIELLERQVHAVGLMLPSGDDYLRPLAEADSEWFDSFATDIEDRALALNNALTAAIPMLGIAGHSDEIGDLTEVERMLLHCAERARAVRQTGRFFARPAAEDEGAREIMQAFATDLGRRLHDYSEKVGHVVLKLAE